MASSSSSEQIPQIIKFAYENYTVSGGKRIAKCKFCTSERVTITEKSGTTSNFVRHVERAHNQR
jgi:hypothetical protein